MRSCNHPPGDPDRRIEETVALDPLVMLSATTQDKEETMTNVQARQIQELKGGFKGEVLLPSDDGYESARKIWNGMIDKHPALIVRCGSTPDVVRAVNFARDNGLVLTIR